ncbi:MAG: zinc-dependent metalloprotease [Bdellovibrio sp.]|nr:zinc-dependent metalloprotease [Bdellovibrio sp.]
MSTKTGKTKTAVRVLAILSLGLIAACTKQIPYEELPPGQKEHTVSKTMVDTTAEYLYSASMQNASRTSADALPFSSGDNKRVRLEIAEHSIRVLETERDARYAPNKANDKLVLEIPIEHTQFTCAKDRFGECTNKEENDEKVPWAQRNGIKVKLEDAKSGELDLLPIMISQTLGENCYEPVSARLVSSVIESDAINFQVERTFKTRLDCLSNNIDSLSDAMVTANFHYSFVKLNAVLSKGFKTVSYPEGSADERTFGFFSSRRTVLDVDHNKTDKTTIQVMNHWNPERSEIVYHLSDEFAKPENKLIKDLTVETVDNLNKGLEISGVKFRINLKEPSGKVPGDIRNSMIVLVEDPVESSIIGYGPQTEDPVTGEIISARTVMFLGTIKKFIKSTYEEIRLAKGELTAPAGTGGTGAKTAAQNTVVSEQLQAQTLKLKASSKASKAVAKLSEINKSVAVKTVDARLSSVKNAGFASAAKLNQMQKSVKNYTANINPEVVGTDLKSQLKYMNEAKNCAFAPALESAGGGASPRLLAKFSGDLKPWDQLSDSEKNEVVAIILPEIWVPTLIHELGHNLGLRHNFAGSEDKANFHTKEELVKEDIDHDIPFSSVMDYGNDLKTLPVLGKYDIAALRFGYLRTVETKTADDKVAVAKIATTLQDLQKAEPTLAIKEYQYCTDEHTGINAGCKRFDLGTSYTEIVQNMIKDYQDAYAQRNFRNGRANMSMMDDVAYASRINGIFKELRIMMEVRERIKYRFNLADDADEYKSVPFLKDLDDATKIGGAFLASVLMVPDLTCAIASKQKPNQIIGLLPLNNLDSEAMSCFKASLNPAYIVVAQAGKMFNSKKDPDSTNAYMDQIDVRGYWIDKAMALRNLFRRQTGIFNFDRDHVDNFVNVSSLREPLVDIVSNVMLGDVVAPLKFTFADGSTQEIEVPYDLSTSQIIAKPMIPQIGKVLGVNEHAPTELQALLANQFVSGMSDNTGTHEADRSLGMSLSVRRYDSNQPLSSNVTSFTYGTTKYVADSQNVLAKVVIENIGTAQAIESLPSEKVAEILKDKKAQKTAPDTASVEEKAVWNLPVEQIQAAVNGEAKSSDTLIRLLRILPNAID